MDSAEVNIRHIWKNMLKKYQSAAFLFGQILVDLNPNLTKYHKFKSIYRDCNPAKC